MLRTTLGLKLHCSIFAWPICHELRPNLLESILFNPRLSQWRQYVGAQWSVCEGKRFWIECRDIAMLPCISHSFPKMSKEASVLQHKAAPCTIFAAGNAPSGQTVGTACISRLSHAQKKGTETTPYAGSLRTGQLSSLMCPIAPLEHHWAWACHVPMDAQTLSQSLIFLELTLQFSKRSTVTSWFRGWSYPSLLISFFAFWLSRLCQDPAFLLGLALSVCHVRMDSQLTFLAASWPLPFTIPKYCHRISNAARPAVIAAAEATEALSDLAAKRIQRMCVRNVMKSTRQLWKGFMQKDRT